MSWLSDVYNWQKDQLKKPVSALTAATYPITARYDPFAWGTESINKLFPTETTKLPNVTATTPETSKGSSLQTPQLQPYTYSPVSISGEQQSLIDLINSLVTGQYGQYKQLLSGLPDYGLLTQAVLQPATTQLKTQTLPAIADIYSGGPYGAGYWTGARQSAQEKAATQLASDITGTRYQAQQQALDRSLQAIGQMPSMMSTLDIQRQTDMYNAGMAMQTWYQNQGLTQTMFQDDVAIAQQILSEAGFGLQEEMFAWQQWQYEDQMKWQKEQIKQAEQAAMWGGIGTVGGALPGLLAGNPLLAMAGAQAGSSLGQYFGGSPTTGYQSLQSAIPNYMLMQLLTRGQGGGSVSPYRG